MRVVERRAKGLAELFVGVEDQRLCWIIREADDPALEDYLSRYTPGLREGNRIEVNFEALSELERVAGVLRRGYILSIDYGYTAEEIAAGRRFTHGSLMAYENHQAKTDVLAEPGRRDMTAHVNFTALEERGRNLGFEPLGLRTQARFLLDLGEADNFAGALEGPKSDAFQLRMQLKSLLFGMGETFRVLVQRK